MAAHPSYPALEAEHRPDWEALIRNLRREGTPARAHHMELFHDGEIFWAIVQRYGLDQGLDRDDPHFFHHANIRLRRFLGFDYVSSGVAADQYPDFARDVVKDTADLERQGGRGYLNEHRGPIMSREDFERFRWPSFRHPAATAELEWYEQNLPDDMCIVGMAGGHFAEWLCWLMGYETFCLALHDQRDLVRAIEAKLREMFAEAVDAVLQFSRVRAVWGSDDMGFKTQLLVSPADAREFFLPGHRLLARKAHDAGRVYLFHSCGNLRPIFDDLCDDVRIDALHSFEDTIYDVRELKAGLGQRIAMVGGIDVDFLCRADEAAIRRRVRETLDRCMPGGGYCLGTGNSVTNYIPLDHYLAMVDEGWRWSRGG